MKLKKHLISTFDRKMTGPNPTDFEASNIRTFCGIVFANPDEIGDRVATKKDGLQIGDTKYCKTCERLRREWKHKRLLEAAEASRQANKALNSGND